MSAIVAGREPAQDAGSDAYRLNWPALAGSKSGPLVHLVVTGFSRLPLRRPAKRVDPDAATGRIRDLAWPPYVLPLERGGDCQWTGARS